MPRLTEVKMLHKLFYYHYICKKTVSEVLTLQLTKYWESVTKPQFQLLVIRTELQNQR